MGGLFCFCLRIGGMDKATFINLAWGVFTLIVGFIFKVVFGLIGKNETKSDRADARLEREIEKVEEKFRANDYTLFERMADVESRLAAHDAKFDCLGGK